MAHLSLSLFGGFSATLDAQPVTAFGTDKARALLAYLAVESARPHRRAILASMFWPELPQPRAAHNLSQTLLRLRRALHEDQPTAGAVPPSFLLAIGQDLRFNPLSDYQLDVADFLSLIDSYRQHKHPKAEGCSVCIGWLKRAADLYRGELLAGFAVRDSVPFDEWQVLQQEALHSKAIEVFGLLATYCERLGDLAQTLVYARRLVRLEPWHERANLQIMTALAQSGEEAAAVEQYVAFNRILAQEFGMKPPPEATALYDRIRTRKVGKLIEQPNAAIRPAAAVTQPMIEERRQVTALLIHWHLPNIDDPEEMQEGLVSFSATVAQAAERYGGRIEPRHGTEFLLYFGYPVAQEDAARRAVSAALALLAARRASEHVRIGLHTGMMVSQGAELLGNVPDLARDCLRLAAPNSVTITADTERLINSWFLCQPFELTGSNAPAPIFQVKEENTRHNRHTWLAQRRLTPLVGRKRELDRLAACLDRLRAGQGQVVTVCGDPGIGKTRLTRAFKSLCPWPATWVESRCSPLLQNTNLYPLTDVLEQLLDFNGEDDPETKRAKLIKELACNDVAFPAAQWLLSLALGLPTDTPAPGAITEEQRERTQDVLLALLRNKAARQPVMILIEDLQWADPSTIEWLERLVNAVAGFRCLLWLNWRPEFTAPWPPQQHQLDLALRPLDPQDSAEIVNSIVGEKTLPDTVRQQIIGQADGIPLYVEELSRTFLESTVRETAALPLTLPLPATLRDSLAARLDRTGMAKETAHWASALGREFEYSILRTVVPYDESRLQTHLAALVEAGLVSARSGQTRYAFKHALIQDAAYFSMLNRTRQDIHRRIAETLTARLPIFVETQPEILAHHYSQAGLVTQAADYWTRAGQRATAQGATLEACTFFDRALASITDDDLERRWQALLGREAMLGLREERAAQGRDIAALLDVAEALDDDRRLAQALLRQADYQYHEDDYHAMLHSSEGAGAAAARAGDQALELLALSDRIVALTRLVHLGAAHQAVDESRRILPLVTDARVQCVALASLALYYSDVGDFTQALQLRRQAAHIALREGDRHEESKHLTSIGYHYTRLGLYAEACAAYERGLELAKAAGDRYLQTNLRFDLCYARWCLGDRDSALAFGGRAAQELRGSGYRHQGMATCLSYLAIILEQEGDYSTAAAYLQESRSLFRGVGLHGPAMEVQAVEARCRLNLGQREEAGRLAGEVWDYLHAHGAVMMDYPSRVAVCIADVASQGAMPGVSERDVLEKSHDELLRRAEAISDLAWRRSFLEDEVSNRALVAHWERLGLTPPPSP